MSNNHFLTAYSFSIAWCKDRFKEFTAEDLQLDYYRHHPPPKHNNEWGNVFRALAKDGIIIFHNTATAKRESSKGRLMRVYISREFSILQSKNRRYKQPELFDNTNQQ